MSDTRKEVGKNGAGKVLLQVKQVCDGGEGCCGAFQGTGVQAEGAANPEALSRARQ